MLGTIKKDGMVEELIFNTYFEDSKLFSLTENSATIVVDNVIQKKVLDYNLSLFASSLNEIFGREYVCQVTLADSVNAVNEYDLPINEPISLFKQQSQKLNPDYTFDTFIIGQSNRVPREAALAASLNPGKFYNPLFIYGDSGLGKTHLLHSIGNYIFEKNSNTNILVITASEFVDGVYKSQRNLDEYKKQLSNIDVFLVDEIQFLADKKKSEEIFFHVFNELVNKGKQVVLTSDCPPHEIRGLEDRLVSRFSSGLTVNITAPEYETAVRIIKSKIEKKASDLDIDDDVIDFIAANYSSDVRKIEGTINRLIFNLIQYPEKERIDLGFAISVLKDSTTNTSKISIKVIKEAVKNFYGLSKGQLEGKSRTSNITTARHIAMYLCRKHLDIPFKEIGDNFGKRDHSTVMNACEKVEKSSITDRNYQIAINKIEDMFNINN